MPLAIAALLALLLQPLLNLAKAVGIGRRLAAALIACAIVFIMLALIGSIIPFLLDEATKLWERLQTFDMSRIEHITGKWLPSGWKLEHIAPGEGTVGNALGAVMGWGQAALSALTLIAILPVFLYFLMAEGALWQRHFLGLFPQRHRSPIKDWLGDLAGGLRSFMTGQGLVCLSQAVWHSLGLLLLGVDFAIILGILTGLSALIPVVGNVLMLSVTLGIASTQFDSWMWLAAIPLLFGAAQAIETFLLAPWLIGGQAKLHPLAVILAVLAGGRIAGFAGALLALPALTAARVSITHLLHHYKQTAFYQNADRDNPTDTTSERA